MSNSSTAQGPTPRPCREFGCPHPVTARNRCSRHYRRFIRDGGLGTSCVLPHCDGGSWAKGLCAPHAARATRYGLTVADLLVLDAREFCDICPAPPEVVDHDHATGLVRGVLCRNCNLALGYFKDSVPVLLSAITYLANPPGALTP